VSECVNKWVGGGTFKRPEYATGTVGIDGRSLRRNDKVTRIAGGSVPNKSCAHVSE
jgi:hypothetical protein